MAIDSNRNSKKCSRCKLIKRREDFYPDRNLKDNMTAYCKECSKQRNKEWREKNPKASAESSLWSRRKFFYKITKEDFEKMITDQDYKCKICKKEINYSAHVDHCHKTQKVRGLLCRPCNQGLGFFYDDINLLNNAINYIKNI